MFEGVEESVEVCRRWRRLSGINVRMFFEFCVIVVYGRWRVED